MKDLKDYPIIVYTQCAACKQRDRKLIILMLNRQAGFCTEECYIFYYSEINQLTQG